MPALAIAGAVMAAVGLATAIGGSVANAMPTRSERERAARLARMREDYAAGEFGLSPQEAAELASIGQGIVAGAEREAIARQGELAALQGISGGALIQQQLASEEAIREQRSQVERELRQAEIQARQMDLQELARLEAQVSQDQLRKKQAAVQAAQDVGAVATSTGLQMGSLGMTTQAPAGAPTGAPPPPTAAAFDPQADLRALAALGSQPTFQYDPAEAARLGVSMPSRRMLSYDQYGNPMSVPDPFGGQDPFR
ncbi:MAG: hypothetical protein ACXADL_16900 [Candidatus Thorarchaeota archaeon]